MENSVYQKDTSFKIYDFLCNVVGTAKIVKNRRLFFKIMEDVLSNSLYTSIVSGSKAEGLDMKGSDFDIMIVMPLLSVYNSQADVDGIFGLIIDTENVVPGFVLLKHPHGFIQYPEFKYTSSECGLLLSSYEFKQTWLGKIDGDDLPLSRYKIHGPCISSRDDMTDNAICLKSQTWPIVCRKWFYRPFHSKWPTSNNIAKIAKEGLLYVPIGSKFGSKNENCLEWRISFSVPEKILIHSFSQAQLMCYALLKIVLKEVINTNSQTKNLMCSYFIKTVMLWLAEESDPSSWNPETIFTCFQSCLDHLIYWILIGYCPNYFMPENNMFEGKIVGKSQKYLLDFLKILRKEGIQLFNRSATLSKFLSENILHNVNDSETEDRAIYPLLRYILVKRLRKSNYQILRRIRGHMVNGSRLTKSLYLLWLMRCYSFMVETIPYKFHALNKHFYQSYKFLLSHCLIAKNIDVVSGGALLSVFFYRHKEYEKCLSVMNYALQECTPDKYYVKSGLCNFQDKDNNKSNISFLQRHKLSCIHFCYISLNPQSALFIPELDIPYVLDQSFIGPPNILIHYYRFMCFHHLGNFVERNRCLLDIELAMKEEFLTGDADSREFGWYYWIQAATVAKCWTEYCTELFWKINFEIFIAMMPNNRN